MEKIKKFFCFVYYTLNHKKNTCVNFNKKNVASNGLKLIYSIM